MNQLIDQPTTGESPAEGSRNRYTAADYQRFVAEQEQLADEAPTAQQRKTAELRAESYRRQLADAVAIEMLAALDRINPEAAGNLRSIQRKLDEADSAFDRGYANGYVDGARRRLGMPTARDLTAAPLVTVPAPVVPDALDMTAVERHFDDIYCSLQEWAAKATTPERTYVSAGHEAVKAIDDAVRALNVLRDELIGEIRSDEDERIVRVDAMLAEGRAAREAQAAEVTL